MLSASNRFKQILVRRWKSPKLLCLYPTISSPCSYSSFHRRRSDSSLKKLHVSISQFLNTNNLTFKTRSFATQASTEQDKIAYQVLDNIISVSKKSQTSVNELCTNHINKLCKNRNLQAAARLLQLLRDKHAIITLPSYNLLLSAACENNNTQIAVNVFQDMLINHISMNSTTYFNIAKTISKSNDFTLVQSFMKEISEIISTKSVTVINQIINAFAECGHVHNSILVFDHIKSLKIKPDLVTYNTMLGILGKAGQVDEMVNVFATMKNSDIAPDIFSYNTLLHSLRKFGRFDLCLVITKEMTKVGLQPDLITYTALIECFLRSGNTEESLRLFGDMKNGNIRPSIYIYRSLISNLKRLGETELALKFLEEMNEFREELVGPKDFKKKNR